MWTCSLLDGLIIFLENVEDGFGQHRLDRAVLLNGQDGERSGNRRIKPASDRLFTDAIALATRRFDRQHRRSEEHTSELQSLMRISYAVFCLKIKNRNDNNSHRITK